MDLRGGITEDGLDRLEWGITSKKPAPTKARPHATAPRLHNLPFSSLGDLLKGRDEELRTPPGGAGHGDHPGADDLRSRRHRQDPARGRVRLALRESIRHRVLRRRGNAQKLCSPIWRIWPGPSCSISPNPKPRPRRRAVAAVLRWLREHDRWLLILDNVDTQEAKEAVLKILPSLSAGRVLITSRIREWPPSVQRQPLETLSLDEAQRFLLERTAERPYPVRGRSGAGPPPGRRARRSPPRPGAGGGVYRPPSDESFRVPGGLGA